jgi:hypothetical protein
MPRDEHYVIDLLDDLLDAPASRQHRFDWLRGDPSPAGRCVRLPVDAYWPDLGLVVEYRERQHDEPVAFFDKPERMTVSGVHRGEQRRLYDARREAMVPAHGLRLVVIRPRDLSARRNGRLLRDAQADVAALGDVLRRRGCRPGRATIRRPGPCSARRGLCRARRGSGSPP